MDSPNASVIVFRMGGGANNPPATVPNPMHAQLAAALRDVTSMQPRYDDCLKGVAAAMKGKAWTGGTSDQFAAELAGHTRSIHAGTQGCIDNVKTALSNCPATKANPAAKHH